MKERQLQRIKTFATEDILTLIRETDLSDPNTFLVLNGGTGVGKTVSIMTEVKEALEKKTNVSQSLLIVESRTATKEQLETEYIDKIERFNGVDVCQRLSFMYLIQKNIINYDWVVIDECHGLFSEASFAMDAELIARWIRTTRTKTHIIFITANDEYFNELSRQYFPDDYNFIYLFPDFTKYVSHTYVKQIQFIKTNKTEAAIEALRPRFTTQKGIIFLKRASDVKDWFFKLLRQNVRVGLTVSQANETECKLTTTQQKTAQDAAINISEGRTGFTMADLCDLYDAVRAQQNKEPIRQAIRNQHLPDDIDVLLATDTIQEGISIKSQIDYIIIEGFTEVEVRQKLGRFRGNLGLLYIVFNPNSVGARLREHLSIFEKVSQLDQVAMAEFYGRQVAMKSSISFVVKKTDKDSGISFYFVNEPAYLDCKRQFQQYTLLRDNPEQAIQALYSYPLLEGKVQVLDYQDIRKTNTNYKIQELAKDWEGIPLKGPAQQELIDDFEKAEIVDDHGRKIDTFKKCCNAFKRAGIVLEDKYSNKKDLEQWSNLFTKTQEKYKIITSIPTI